MSKDGGGLATRVGTTLVVLPLALALVWIPALEWGWCLFVTLVVAVGLHEYYGLARARQLQPQFAIVLLGAAVALSAGLGRPGVTQAALFAACAVAAAMHLAHPRGAVPGMAASLFGLVYVAWFGAHVLFLHQTPDTGPGLVMVLMVAVIMTDVGAYAVGKPFGRHKLAAVVSPNKSWEGAIGGFAMAVVGMLALYYARDAWQSAAFPDWTLLRYLVTGAVLSVSAQAGDLVESALKRDAEVKDSGGFFPGHGGALDRCDGFLFAAPVLYYMEILA